jgi:hypothetical protein
MGSTEDPQPADAAAVAGSIFTAVIIYAVGILSAEWKTTHANSFQGIPSFLRSTSAHSLPGEQAGRDCIELDTRDGKRALEFWRKSRHFYGSYKSGLAELYEVLGKRLCPAVDWRR